MRLALLLLSLAWATPALAQEPSIYPLELVSPREAGTAPSADADTPDMPTGHRIFWAHPSFAYEIRAVVIGGSYPYTFALTNAPSGMTVDADTGVITWTSPSGTVTPTLTVTDAEDTEISEPWTIVTDAAHFVFISPTGNDTTGTGTIAAPWQTLNKTRTGSAGSGGTEEKILVLRGGTYDMTGIPYVDYTGGGSGMTFHRTSWGWGRGATDQWIGYPGETIVVNQGYVEGGFTGILFEDFLNDTWPPYFDNIIFEDFSNQGWRLQYGQLGHYGAWWRVTFRNGEHFYGADNPTAVMFSNGAAPWRHYYSFQNVTCNDLNGARSGSDLAGCAKIYTAKKLLWADNITTGGNTFGDLKANCPRFEVRGNWWYDNSTDDQGILGNMNGTAERCSGEVRYNRITNRGGTSDNYVVQLNQDGHSDHIYVYRNTFVGQLWVRAASSTGAFHFDNNIIINDASGYAAYDRIEYTPGAEGDIDLGTGADANVVGTYGSGIVDEADDLALVGASRTAYLGSKGWEITSQSTPASQPRRLRIRGEDQ